MLLAEHSNGLRHGAWRGPATVRAALTPVVALVLVSCCPKVTTVEAVPDGRPPVVAAQRGDTLAYHVAFPDKAHRKQFVKTFEAFLDRYPYAAVRRDTTDQTVVMRLVPWEHRDTRDTAVADSVGLEPVDEGDFVEQVVELSVDSLRPAFGGTVSVYSDREFWDGHLAELLRTYPFALPPTARPGAPDSVPPGLLSATQLSPKRIALTLAPSLRTAAGAPVGAFELAGRWTALVKARPGEGLALFRHVKGVKPFIGGAEAVIPGFVVSGKESVTLVLEEEDPEAAVRLATPRLMPAELALGPYVASPARGARVVVNANRRGAGGPPWLEACTVVLGGDRNPALNYSLKKYDCMLLTFKEDVEYARRSLCGDSRLVPLEPERYFLSVNSPDIGARRWLCGRVNAAQMLSSSVRAEGKVIGALESDAPVVAQPPAEGEPPPAEEVTILHRAGDPVSSRIAQRLLADLSQARVAAQTRAAGATEYEAALLDGGYTIAVGWVGAAVVRDRAEQLRLATIWFDDDTDENARLAQAREVPLFEIRRYALCRNRIDFAGDSLADMFVQRAPLTEEQGDDE